MSDNMMIGAGIILAGLAIWGIAFSVIQARKIKIPPKDTRPALDKFMDVKKSKS
ncbi:MAG: hypothetical protein HQL51_02340 [Magnetococcales bacterium]|nr:hypothetical protein [Magnetococcales bacterium]